MAKKRVGRGALLLSASFLSGLALLMAVQGAADGFLSHPRFQVTEIEVRWLGTATGREPGQFRLSPPVSIFQLDLAALSRAFRQRYPTAVVERVERVLPNRLIATMRARHVVASLKANGLYVPVSEDGRVVGGASRTPAPGLPVLLLEGVRGPLLPGTDLEPFAFWKVSELLTTLYRDKGLVGRPVAKLQVSGNDLFVFLEKGPEIRFSADRLGPGWHDLWELLNQRRAVLNEVQYVDLRFDDPVIGERRLAKAPARARARQR